MPFVTVEECRAQCRVEGDYDDTFLLALRDAAEDTVTAQLNRSVFPDSAALSAAQRVLPDLLETAQAAWQAARDALVQQPPDNRQRAQTRVDVATVQLQAAQLQAARISHGIVINPSICAAIRLVVGHLYANREAVLTGVTGTELPLGVASLLGPYRLAMTP